jgi:hypothetical protein
LCYVLFLCLSWNLVQNTWIRPENTSRAIWSFPDFKADPDKDENRLRQFDQSIICTINNSIDWLSVKPTSINKDAINRFSEHYKIDWSKFNRSTLYSIDRLPVFQKVQIIPNLCAIQIKSWVLWTEINAGQIWILG